jgi:Spy/CpxP family protein refolding chaperone
MKKLILPLMVISLAFASSYALSKDRDCHRHHGGKHIEYITDELDLSDEQSKQVKAILKESHEKRRAVWEEQRKIIKPKMQAIQEETRDKLATVLSEEQIKEYDEMKAEWKKKREERREKYKERREDDDD